MTLHRADAHTILYRSIQEICCVRWLLLISIRMVSPNLSIFLSKIALLRYANIVPSVAHFSNENTADGPNLQFIVTYHLPRDMTNATKCMHCGKLGCYANRTVSFMRAIMYLNCICLFGSICFARRNPW